MFIQYVQLILENVISVFVDIDFYEYSMEEGAAIIPLKVSAYIDGANLFHAGESIGVRIDYKKLKSLIEQKGFLVDLNYYDTTENKPQERSFFKKIQSLGYTVKTVRLHRYGSQPPEEKMIDTQIVADSLIDGLVENKFDIAVFASGDKDILPAIEYLLHKNKQVEIMSFRHALAWDLRRSSAKIIDLTKIIDYIRRI